MNHIVLVMDSDKIGNSTGYTYDTASVREIVRKLESSLGKKFVNKIDVIYNTLSKDFGDFRESIDTQLDKIYEGGKYWI